MYNLLIALGISLALFGVGWGVAGWIAGFVPAILAFGVAYFLLARRTGQKLEAVMATAMQHFQAGRAEKGRKVIEGAFALGKWQFLVEGQIHAQLGVLDYMQRKFGPARTHLSKAWSRNWQAHAFLAAIDYREKKLDDALERLEKTTGAAGKESLFWGLYAWIALESGDRERALKVLAQGIDKTKGSKQLSELADQIRNKKKLKMKVLGQGWYQFFPEQMPRSMMMQMGAQTQNRRRGGYTFPQPRR